MLTVGKYNKEIAALMPLPINNTNSQIPIECWGPEYVCGCLFLKPHFLCRYLQTWCLVGWLMCVSDSAGACM